MEVSTAEFAFFLQENLPSVALHIRRPHLLLLLLSAGASSLSEDGAVLIEGGIFLINSGVLLPRGQSPVEIMPPLGVRFHALIGRVRLRAGGATAVRVPVPGVILKPLQLLAPLLVAVPSGQGHVYPKGRRPTRFKACRLCPSRLEMCQRIGPQADHSQRVSYRSSEAPSPSPAISLTRAVTLGVTPDI